MKKITVFLWVFLILPGLIMAKTFQLKPDLKVVLPDVEAPWSVSTEPIEALVEHLSEHVIEEAAGKGKKLTEEQARQVALKRARSNQLFVVNKNSGAHLLISFSPLNKGESAPSARTVALSAKSAAGGVADEGWEVESTRFAVTAISGAQKAQWFAIDYTHEGERSLFMGIVGFAHPYWFWFYGNDHLENPEDKEILEKLMLGIKIEVDKE
jgi:hypothetical protein